MGLVWDDLISKGACLERKKKTNTKNKNKEDDGVIGGQVVCSAGSR